MPNSLSLRSHVLLLALFFAVLTDAALGQSEHAPANEANAQNLVVAANQFYKLKQYDRAIEVAKNAVVLLPKDHRPWAIIGNSYTAQWKMKSASEAYAKAAEINPGLKYLWYLKAFADRNRNAREESIAAAKKAIELDPNYAEAYIVLGQSLGMGSKDTKGALEAFRKAFKAKPELIQAAEEYGSELSYHGDEKGAEEVYRKSLASDPNGMACRFLLGRLLVKRGRLAEAREIWNGRKYDETNTFPLFITLLERAEKKKAAIDKLAANPEDAQALFEMGIIEMDGESWVVDDRQKRAIKYFKKALVKKPDFVQAQYTICKAYVQIADTDKDANPDLDRELAALRRMDPKMAGEIEEYRKTYSGSIKGFSALPVDQ